MDSRLAIGGAIALAIALIAALSAAGWLFSQPASQEKVKIGVMAPFSGQTAWWGEYIRQGIEIAFEELPEKEKQNIELVWEDDQCLSQPAVSAAQKLVFADGVKFVIGPLCNESTIPTEEIFEGNKIISLTTGLPNDKIASMGAYHFSFLPEIKELMKELAKFAFEKKESRRAAILYIQGDYGFENYYYFKKYFEDSGGKVVSEESFDISATDVKTQIAKIKAQNPDSILIASYGPNLILVLKQIEEACLDATQRYGINAFEAQQVLQEAPLLAEGVIYPKAGSNEATQAMLDYAEKYREKFGAEADVYSANAYDSFKILAATIKECKSDSGCVLQEISKLKDYAGANGNFSLDKRGAAKFEQILLKTVKNGKFVVLESQ